MVLLAVWELYICCWWLKWNRSHGICILGNCSININGNPPNFIYWVASLWKQNDHLTVVPVWAFGFSLYGNPHMWNYQNVKINEKLRRSIALKAFIRWWYSLSYQPYWAVFVFVNQIAKWGLVEGVGVCFCCGGWMALVLEDNQVKRTSRKGNFLFHLSGIDGFLN